MATQIKKNGFTAWFTFTLVSLFLVYEMALQVAPSIMTNSLMHDLHLGAKVLSSAVGVYFITYAGMQIPAGLLFDRYSMRFIMMMVTLVCALSAFIYGYSEGPKSLALARLMMGGASAFAFVAVLTVANRWFSARYYAALVGVAQLLASMGAGAITALLSWHLESVSWREAFTHLGLFGLGLLVAFVLFIKRSPQHAITENKQLEQLGVKASFLVIAKNKQTWYLFAYAFLMWGPVTIFAGLWGPQFLEVQHGLSTSEASSIILWYFWTPMALISPFIGYLSDFMKLRKPLMWITAVLGFVATVIMVQKPDVSLGFTQIVLAVFGVATSGQILSFAVAREINRADVASTVMGVTNMGVVSGGWVLQPLVGQLLESFTDMTQIVEGASLPMASFQLALTVMPLCFLLAYLVSRFLIKETYCQNQV